MDIFFLGRQEIFAGKNNKKKFHDAVCPILGDLKDKVNKQTRRDMYVPTYLPT